MTLRAGITFGINQQRGFWLRCFLGILILAWSASIGGAQCVNRTIRVSRVQGAIFDRSGQPVANVAVNLKQQADPIASSKTDSLGRFSMSARPGTYALNANLAGFVPGYIRIDVGSGFARLLRRTQLWIILDVGMPNEYCTFATTNRRRFEKAITNHDPLTTDRE